MRIGATEETCLNSPVSAFHSFTIEHDALFNGGEADIRRYVWNHPTADIWASHSYFIDMPITPRPQPNWAIYRDARNRRVPLNRIWFVPPGLSIESGTNIGSQRSLHLSIDKSMFEDVFEVEPDWTDFIREEDFNLCGTAVEWLLMQLVRELQQPGLASQLVMESLTRAVAVMVARLCHLERDEPHAYATGGLAPWRMRQIRERTLADLPAPKLQELADLCGLSVRHLSRAFKMETGQTVAHFVQQATIDRALAKLADRSQPVSEIARSLGFSSAASFAYAFRRATGLRPSEVSGRG